MSGERGSVSVVLAASLVIVLVLAMGTADLGRALVARSQARTAADAAALAAAQELAIPSGADPAQLAAAYAEANRAVLIVCSCAVGTTQATVEVQVEVGGLLLVPGSPVVTARARAVVDLPSA